MYRAPDVRAKIYAAPLLYLTLVPFVPSPPTEDVVHLLSVSAPLVPSRLLIIDIALR